MPKPLYIQPEDDYGRAEAVGVQPIREPAPSYDMAGYGQFIQGISPYARQGQTGVSFWTDPTRVARYYLAGQNAITTGATMPEWMSSIYPYLELGYKYMQAKNPGKQWYEWQADDKFNEAMGALTVVPPIEALPDFERKEYGNWSYKMERDGFVPVSMYEAAAWLPKEQLDQLKAIQPGNQEVLYVPQDLYDGMVQSQTSGNPTMGVPAGELPKDEQAIMTVLNNPITMGLTISGFPMALSAIGAATTGGGAAALVSMLPGAALLAGGVALGMLAKNEQELRGDDQGFFTSISYALDALAEGVERVGGFASQLVDQPGEVLANPKEAWRAGHLFWDTTGALAKLISDDGKVMNYAESQQYDKERGGRHKWYIRGLDGEVREITNEEYDYAWLLEETRKRLIDGEDPYQVYADIQNRVGAYGALGEAVGHIFLDPMNVLGDVTAGVGKAGAKGYHARVTGDIAKLSDEIRIATEQVNLGGLDDAAKAAKLDDIYIKSETLKNLEAKKLDLEAQMDAWDISGVVDSTHGGAITGARGAFYKTVDLLIGIPGNADMSRVFKFHDAYKKLLVDRVGDPETIYRMSRYAQAAAGVTYDKKTDTFSWRMLTPMKDRKGLARTFDFVFHETPLSQAQSVVGQAESVVVALTDGLDVNNLYDTIQKISTGSEELAQQYQFMKTPGGMAMTMALKDFSKDAETHFAFLNAPEAQMARKVYDALAYAVDDTTDYHRYAMQKSSDTLAKADELLRRAKTNLQNKAAAGDTKAAELLKTLETADAAGIVKFSNLYKQKHIYLTDDEFRAVLMADLLSRVEDWAGARFGVKPDMIGVKFSKMIKSFQGVALLGLNPFFAANNWVTNVTTMAYTGTLGITSVKDADTFFGKFGMQTSRVNEGAGAAGEILLEKGEGKPFVEYRQGDTLRGYKKSEKGTVADKIDQATAFGRKGMERIGLMATLSQKIERSHSATIMAKTTGEAFSSLWKQGSGFKPLAPEAEQALLSRGFTKGDIQNLYAIVEYAGKSGFTIDAIQKAIFDGTPTYSSRSIKNPDLKKMFDDFGLTPELDRRLAAAKTEAEARAVMDDMHDRLIYEAEKKANTAHVQQVREVIDEILVEGLGSVAQRIDGMHAQRGERHLQWLADLEAHYEEIAGVSDYKVKREMNARFFEQAQRKWNLTWREEQNATIGIVQALIRDASTDNPLTVRMADDAYQIHKLWDGFFKKRGDLAKAIYALDTPGSEGYVRSLLIDALGETRVREILGEAPQLDRYWAAMQEAMGVEYQKALDSEAALMDDMEDGYLAAFAVQYPQATTEAKAWRVAAKKYRALMAGAQQYFRDGKADGLAAMGAEGVAIKQAIDRILVKPLSQMTHGERSAAWRKFQNEVYAGLIGRQRAETFGAQTVAHDATMRPQTPPPTEQPQAQVPVKPVEEPAAEPPKPVEPQVTDEERNRRVQQARVETQREMDIQHEAAALVENVPMTRQLFKEAVAAAMPDLTEEQLDAFMLFQDARAEYWSVKSREAGKPRAADEWWTDNLRAVQKGGAGELLQLQQQQAWYYSQLQRVIEQKMPVKASPDQIRGMIRGLVKEDELAWTGFNQWLDKQTGAISKGDVIDYLEGNRIVVRTVEKTTLPPAELEVLKEKAQETGDWTEYDAAKQTKYDEYTIPGGKNYREVLLTFDNGGGFRLGHWAEENVLVHFRLTDHVDANGKKVLFIEEIQSDWHQKGRKYGYSTSDPGYSTSDPGVLADLGSSTPIKFSSVKDAEKYLIDTFGFMEDEALEFIKRTNENSSTIIPRAPFSKSWEELAIKRITRYAAEQGYDSVAWVSGDIPLKKFFTNDDGAGMRAFYDEMLPSIVKKYIKRWNGEIRQVSLPDAGVDVSGFDVSPAMRNGVLAGQPLFQQGDTAVKAAVSIADDGRMILHAFEAADISSLVHEVSGHVWLRSIATDPIFADDVAVLTKWLREDAGMADLPDDWAARPVDDFVDAHEYVARANERYLAEGVAPAGASKQLVKVFQSFKEWLLRIYKKIIGSDIDVKLSPEVRKLFDKWTMGGKEMPAETPTPVKPTPDVAVEAGKPVVEVPELIRDLQKQKANWTKEQWLEDARARGVPEDELEGTLMQRKAVMVTAYLKGDLPLDALAEFPDIYEIYKAVGNPNARVELPAPVLPEEAVRATPKYTQRKNVALRDWIDGLTTEQKDQALMQLHSELYEDALTGLPNLKAWAAAEKTPVAVLMDVRGLKMTNDKYGMQAGDLLLQAIGEIVRKYAGDDGYHLHGDEFVFQHTDPVEARRILDLIQADVRNLVIKTPDSKRLTGFDIHTGMGEGAGDEPFMRADDALRAGKAGTDRMAAGVREVEAVKPVEEHAAPAVEKPVGEGEQPMLFQRNKRQRSLFDDAVDDLPIFSGTPVRATDQVFKPKEQGPTQLSMFEEAVQKPASRIVEIIVREGDATSYTRIDLARLDTLKKFLDLNKGVALEYQIVDANGKVLSTGGDARDILSQTLFQASAAASKKGKSIVKTSDGKEYEFVYRVVGLDDIQASHDVNGNPNPKYPEGLQTRDRADDRYQATMVERASHLDPFLLLEEHHALDRGTPIVGSDMAVESGNGRTISMQLARDGYPEKWKEYQAALLTKLEDVGVDPKSIEGIKDPVLIRERVTDVPDRRAFVDMCNRSTSEEMSASEHARIDAETLPIDAIYKLDVSLNETLASALNADKNKDIVNTILASFPISERGALVGGDGKLNNAGYKRVLNALIGICYGENTRILDALVDENMSIKTLANVIVDTLPQVSRLETGVRLQQVRSDLSIAPDISAAFDMIIRLRQQNMSVMDYLRQTGAGDLDPVQRALLAYVDKNLKKRGKLNMLIRNYVESAMMQPSGAQTGLFSDAYLTKSSILDGVIKKLDGQDATFEEIPNLEGGIITQKPVAPQEQPAPVKPPEAPVEQGQPPVAPEAPVEQPQPIPLVGEAPGTVVRTGRQLPPIGAIEAEAIGQLPWNDAVRDVVKNPDLDGSLVRKIEAQYRAAHPDATPEQVKQNTTDMVRDLRKYLGGVDADLRGTKLTAYHYGEARRDWTLLNYQKRAGLDDVLEGVFPYQFWYTHSLANWAMRMYANPQYFGHYLKLNELAEKLSREDETTPTRLKGKFKIPVPFLPDWMGDSIYVDPMKVLFPFQQFLRPMTKNMQNNNYRAKRALGILQEWAEGEEYPRDDVMQALQTRSGELWQKALAQAEIEIDNDPADVIRTIMSPSLPLQMATTPVSEWTQLPPVRAAQNVAGVMGYTDTVFPDKQFRAAFDLPERDAYTQYAVDQMLANMAAEMPERADEFAQAMIDQKGAAWDEAMKRIGKTQFGKYIGAPLALDFFPEGERGQRELRVEYSKALDKYMTGDSAAYSKFFDEHPEYEVQREAWRDPAQRMSKLLISKIWDRYLALDSASKKKVQEQFGKQFKDAFLNAATRSYETIDNATLATWAKSLGGSAPETAGGATMQIETTDPEIVKGIDAYYAQRDQLFPNVAQYQTLMFSLPANQQKEFAAQFPQYQAYQQWRNQYIASHPELTSYLTSEQSELNGLPAEIQQAVYQYRANKDQLFPGIDDVQSQYYAQPEASRKAWLKQHPELSGYWEWKRQFTAAYPKAAAWIMSEQSMSNAVLGYSTPAFDPSITGAFSPELSSALLRYVYNGEAFSSGAMMELERVWKENGQPGGTFEAWISLMKDYFKQ